jgi:maleate cis-trans isomerase
MPRRQDFRRIGLLVPSSSSVQEQDFFRVLPKDITLHVARRTDRKLTRLYWHAVTGVRSASSIS